MENVRMGELAVSSRAGDEIVAIGLGSCIGLAMIDRDAGVAGLATSFSPSLWVSLGRLRSSRTSWCQNCWRRWLPPVP